MIFLKNTALAVAALAGSVAGQTSFMNAPEPKWTASFSPMGQGNGVVVAPDNTALYATSNDGSVGAFSAEDGSIIWTYKAASGGSIPLTGNGEVSVAVDGSYLVYGVTENRNRDGENWYVELTVKCRRQVSPCKRSSVFPQLCFQQPSDGTLCFR
jgi:outer membrane protein assembly factor BamB